MTIIYRILANRYGIDDRIYRTHYAGNTQNKQELVDIINREFIRIN